MVAGEGASTRRANIRQLFDAFRFSSGVYLKGKYISWKEIHVAWFLSIFKV